MPTPISFFLSPFWIFGKNCETYIRVALKFQIYVAEDLFLA